MYRLILGVCLLFSLLKTTNAQHTDKLLNEEYYSAFHSGLDEIDVPANDHISKDLKKALPSLNGKVLTLVENKSGRNKGILFAEDGGRVVFSTEFKRNNLHGTWLSRYTDSRLADSGRFQHNLPDGEWRSWYPNGTLRSVRTYSADKWNAVRNEVSRRNTKIYFHNLSRMVNWNHSHFELLTDGAASFASLPAEGKKYQPPYKYCLHHGLFMNFYPNGAIKDSGYYKNGLRDGIWNEYYTNEQVSASGFYLNGLKNSGWKYYSKDGRLTALASYKHGRLVHRKNYNHKGETHP